MTTAHLAVMLLLSSGVPSPAPVGAPASPPAASGYEDLDAPLSPRGRENRLLLAARRGELDVVKALVEGGERVNPPSGWRTPLIAAALHDQVAVMEYLLDRGAQADARDRLGRSALWAALWAEKAAAARLLIARGAAVDVPAKSGETPLFLAVERGLVDLARELIARGADVDRPSPGVLLVGYRPLHRAAMMGRLDVLRLLLEHGADPQAKTPQGQTAADLAQGPQADAIRALLKSPPRPAPRR